METHTYAGVGERISGETDIRNFLSMYTVHIRETSRLYEAQTPCPCQTICSSRLPFFEHGHVFSANYKRAWQQNTSSADGRNTLSC